MKKQQLKKKSEEKLRRQEETRKQKKKQNELIVLYVIAGFLALVLLVTGIVFAVKYIKKAILDSGSSYRNTVLYETEHHEVNAAMLSYGFYDYLYGGILDMYGVDDPEGLKLIGNTEMGVSYYDALSKSVANNMMRDCCYAEAATKRGLSLDDTDNRYIENKLTAIENAASAIGAETEEYLFATYGRGVKLSDIRDALELEALAQKECDTVELSLTVSEEELNEYLSSSDALAYYRIDYYLIGIGVGEKEGDSKETVAEKQKAAYEKAVNLSKAGSLSEYLALARGYIREAYPDETDISIEEILEGGHYVGEAFNLTENSKQIDRWLYDLNRKEGDTVAFDGTINACALYVEKAPYSVDTPNDAYRLISLYEDNFASRSDAVELLNEIYEEYENGTHSEERFTELVTKYSQNCVLQARGGYTDDTSADTALNSQLAEWKTEAEKNGGLKIGDVKQLYTASGMFIAYYCGQGDTRSRVEAKEALLDMKYAEALKYSTYSAKYPVSVNEDADLTDHAPLYTEDDD